MNRHWMVVSRRAQVVDQVCQRRARRRPPTPRAGDAPAVGNSVCSQALMPKLPRLGRRQVDAGRLENRFIGGCRHPGPPRTRPSHSLVVEEAVEVCESNCRGCWGARRVVPPSPRLRRTVVVPFSSLARCEAWRVARPNLFGGGASRLPTREGCSPAPDGASCENHPRIRPYLVVAPSGAAFWVGVRVFQRLYNHHSRAEGRVR